MRFRPVQLAYTVIQGNFLGRAKTFGKKEALAVSELLVNSSCGYTSYHGLVEQFGGAVVEEMVQRNFLHLCPVSEFSRDLIPSPSEPVVTAQSEPALRAMEAFLNKYVK
jgi:hypothetical protein